MSSPPSRLAQNRMEALNYTTLTQRPCCQRCVHSKPMRGGHTLYCRHVKAEVGPYSVCDAIDATVTKR